MKKAILLAAVILLSFQLISCGKKVDGKYAYEKDPKRTIEFKDGMAPYFFGIKLPFEIKGNILYVTYQGASMEYAEIIDSKTLKIGEKIYKKVD